MKHDEQRHEAVEVELPPEPPCKECGVRGAHFCVGKDGHSTKSWSAKRASSKTQDTNGGGE